MITRFSHTLSERYHTVNLEKKKLLFRNVLCTTGIFRVCELAATQGTGPIGFDNIVRICKTRHLS